jgi:thiosulfate/3-mercaptopyruvate sulfurtransferase
MPRKLCPVVDAVDLLGAGRKNLIIFDVSTGKNAFANYLVGHLDGAFFIDLNSQLANIHEDAAVGGRHPLPTIEQFSEVLNGFGVTAKSHIVVYDDAFGGNAAARFWWMLRAAGHKKVQVLNGGFAAAKMSSYPISAVVEVPKKSEPYILNRWVLPLADMQKVEAVSCLSGYKVIDVRSRERYRGESEPIDLIAGHIPGAVNVPFTENLDGRGLFLEAGVLKAKYKAVLAGVDAEHTIVHCGSGVTACHTILAMDYAGLDIPKLYVGSWSEWSRNGKVVVVEE